MTTDQSEDFITALQHAEAYPHSTENITLFETHISWVLLTGQYAYKIKKPVDFGFLDFSTLEKRRFYCEEECRLNGRLAPQLYLGVVPICGKPEAPHINGNGTAFEYAVKMRQFDPRQTFDELLARNALSAEIIDKTANVLAHFHQKIKIADTDDNFGTPTAIEQPVQENFTQLAQALATVSDIDDVTSNCHHLQAWSQEQFKKLHDIFQQRKQSGFIRECHGDLHLRNIMFWDNQVIPFDGIEFNANLRWIDVTSELAFLLMDLDDHQQAPLAHQLLNRYLSLTGDYQGLSILRFYQVYRAMVRAKVASLRLAQVAEPTDCLNEIRNYVDLGLHYTQARPVKLIITHGFSGSGKSYLAQQLAIEGDLIHLRSDVERKRLFGLSETARSDSQINTGIYQQDATQATYERLSTLAEQCLSNGFSVIVDATFLQQAQRTLFRSLAQRVGCDFYILDCQTETAIMQQRIQQREHKGTDASEADMAVLNQQLQNQQALTSEEQAITLPVRTAENVDVPGIIKQLLPANS